MHEPSPPVPRSVTRRSRRELASRWLALIPPLLAVLYVHHGWLSGPSQAVAGDLNLWGWLEGTQHWYWHIAHDLVHGVNPFANNFKAFPDGNYHLMLHGNFGDALLSAPFQWLFSFPLSYNLTVLLFTVLNLLGVYRFARLFTDHRIVASLAACLVVVHPYFLAQLEQGRLTQYLVCWPFFALAEAAPLMRDTGRRIWRLVFCWVATFVSFWFYGIFLSLFLAAWVLVATRHTPWRSKLSFLKALGWTVAWTTPFGLPLAIEALGGGGIAGVEFFTAPVFGTRWNMSAVPADFLLLRKSDFGVVLLPLTMLMASFLALLADRGGQPARPEWDLWALGVGVLGAAVLALGPFLIVYNGDVPEPLMPLPWYLLYVALPFFSRLSYPAMVFPFLLAGMLGITLLAARNLAAISANRVARHWFPAVLFGLVLLELVIRAPADLSADHYVAPEPYHWLSTQEQADAIVEYPFGYTDCARIHQPIHGKCLMGTEGRFEDLRQWPPVDNLFKRSPALEKMAAVQRGEQPQPIPVEELRALYAEGFDYLVFRPISCGKQQELSPTWVATARNWLEEMLGPPVRDADGVAVFVLPGSGPQLAVCGKTQK